MRYNEFKINLLEAILDEVEMSPKALQDFMSSPEAQGIKMGFELEMVVPGAREDSDDGDSEKDYGYDERTSDIENIVNFFDDHDYNTSESLRILRNQLYENFQEWQDRAFDEWVASTTGQKAFDAEARSVLKTTKMFNSEQEEEDAYKDLVANQRTRQFANSDNEEAYMRTMENLRDEFNDDAGNEQEWLEDVGLDYMSDVENEYDMTWPHWDYPDQETYLNIDWVTDEFTEHTGLKAKGYENYHAGSRGTQSAEGHWLIEPDSSIDTDEPDEAGLEFISPPLELPMAFEQLKKVLAWAEDHGCFTNKSTGFHINVSVPGLSEANTDYVKLAIFLGDKHILEQFDRLSNMYCKSALDKISNRASKIKPDEMQNVMANLRQGLNQEASKLVHGWTTDKYTSINTKSNYVEFRGPGGYNYDQDVTKLTNTALRTAYALKIANDPNAYKKEYMKKFYKLITDQKQKDDVQKFNQYIAMYQAGDKDERKKVLTYIRNNIEFRRELKKEVPSGEKETWWVMNKDGSGGKQMVFAHSKSEAIDIGGSNMGYNQDYSRAHLTAVKKTDTVRRYTVIDKYDASRSVQVLSQDIDSAVVIGADKLGVSADNVRALSSDTSQDGKEEISHEIKNGDTGAVLERIPKSLALTPEELEGRRQHWVSQIHLPDHVVVIDPPLSQAELAINEPANAEEIYQSLPDGFKSYLDGIGNETPAAIQATIDRLLAPGVQHLNDEQRQLAISRMRRELSRRELRSRSEELNPNDVARSMPERWKGWILTSLPHLNRGTLQSVYDRLRDSPQSDTDIDATQRGWLINRIKQELDFRNSADSQAHEPEPQAPQSQQRVYRVWDTRPGGRTWSFPSTSPEEAILWVKRREGVPQQYLAVEETDIPVPQAS